MKCNHCGETFQPLNMECPKCEIETEKDMMACARAEEQERWEPAVRAFLEFYDLDMEPGGNSNAEIQAMFDRAVMLCEIAMGRRDPTVPTVRIAGKDLPAWLKEPVERKPEGD